MLAFWRHLFMTYDTSAFRWKSSQSFWETGFSSVELLLFRCTRHNSVLSLSPAWSGRWRQCFTILLEQLVTSYPGYSQSSTALAFFVITCFSSQLHTSWWLSYVVAACRGTLYSLFESCVESNIALVVKILPHLRKFQIFVCFIKHANSALY